MPTIQSVDSHHLIFVEPDIYWVTGGNIPSQLGPMPFKRIVFNFHIYCGDRSPVTGNPTDLLRCLQSEETAASEQDITRLSMGSAAQPSGTGHLHERVRRDDEHSAGGLRRRVGRAWTTWAGSTGPGSTTTIPRARRPRGWCSPTGRTRRSSRCCRARIRRRSQATPTPSSSIPSPVRSAWSYAPTQAASGVTTVVHRGVAALPERVVRGGEGRAHHLAARCDAPHRADRRAPAAGVRLGDGGACPSS